MQECFGLKLFELDNICTVNFMLLYSAVEIDLLLEALNTLTYADSGMFYNDMKYCQIVRYTSMSFCN